MAILPDPELMAYYRQKLAGKGRPYVDGFAVGFLSGAIHRIVEVHTVECPGCATCEELVDVVSALAAIAVEQGPPTPELLAMMPRPTK
jgi:hypothetical protein